MHATERSIWPAITIAVVAAAVGLVGLPLVFGSLPDPIQAVLWLALAVGACVCLLLPARPLSHALAVALAGVPERRGVQSTWSRRAATDVARLIIAAAYLLLVQAILRHPVVAVFGASAEPFLIEAAIAVFVFLVVLVLLSWIYREARPLVEGMAWSVLDSLFATSRSEEAAHAARAIGPVVTSTLAGTPGSPATVTRLGAGKDGVDETLPRSAGARG